MLRPNYSLIEQAGGLSVQWTPPSLPLLFLPVGLSLAVLGLAVFFFRKPLSEGLRPLLNADWLTERFVRWTSLGVVGVSAVLALFAGPNVPLVSWNLSRQGLAIKSLNGDVQIPWEKIDSVRLEGEKEDLADSSLVIDYDKGKKAWLVMKWVLVPHRLRIAKALAGVIPDKMKPVTENAAYMEKIRER
ncbi:MAG: hypothetical protein HY548_04680 [Elusimicrobia bacterium]|nr:hypothetical protein [Elusimicrobiota bacterium]